jgi:hypothetical protein
MTQTDLKDLYRDEHNKDVYANDECYYDPAASYSDNYVHWLELKLIQELKKVTPTNNDNA